LTSFTLSVLVGLYLFHKGHFRPLMEWSRDACFLVSRNGCDRQGSIIEIGENGCTSNKMISKQDIFPRGLRRAAFLSSRVTPPAIRSEFPWLLLLGPGTEMALQARGMAGGEVQ
ncbi:unnamed protein product, partial [Hapterophycus canaliculatus]